MLGGGVANIASATTRNAQVVWANIFFSLPSFVPQVILKERARRISADANLRRVAITILAQCAALVLSHTKTKRERSLLVLIRQRSGFSRRVALADDSAKDHYDDDGFRTGRPHATSSGTFL